MDQPPSPPKPHRGAPRGNQNALKHGFYTRHFDKVDLADLKTASFDGLNDEITLLRVFMRRLIDRYQSSDDLYSALAVVRALSIASFSLARLVHLYILWCLPPLIGSPFPAASATRRGVREGGWGVR